MNDTELLTLAAKAAGMEPPFDALGGLRAWVGSPEGGHWWSPLEDDGDALRLASAFEMDLRFIGTGAIARAHFENSIWPKIKDDDYKRAIVRAAAEIWRTMP